MSKDYNRLKPWIEKMCKEAHLPVYKVANRAGISRAIIYGWMSDKHRPDSDTILRVAQVFATATGRDSAKLHAEALAQYTPRSEGRTPGYTVGPKAVTARS